jgi:lipid-binding SYLF domain-containing protein
MTKTHTIVGTLLLALSGTVFADKYEDTIELFRNAGAADEFFASAYGYAVFPTIAKAGFGIGGARGKGQVFIREQSAGETTMTQLTLGFQIGAQGFSQVIFFEDERSFREFSSGSFEFGANAGAVAITAAASASAATSGTTAGASGGKSDAAVAGGSYYKGMKVFTITKGGLMYEVSVGGQKFSYRPYSS